MPAELVWDTSIANGDLGSAPTATTDNNVFDARTKTDIGLSADITGGTSPTLVVTVYFYDALAASFELTGDSYTLDPATDNLAVFNPNGLWLGFTVSPTGAPSSYNLDIGHR
jgi:hypothetical protein